MTSLHHEEAPPAGRQRSRARLGIWIFFLLHGTLVGTWAARIPDIKDIFWAVAGFGLTGLGFSCVYPKIVAAAGHLDPSRAARNITRVSGAGFVGLLVSPGLIGVLADRWGLTTALWLPVLQTVGLAMAAPVLRAKRSGPRASQH
jgi:MFS family permease